MRNDFDMKINAPLANTYGWLRVNGTRVPGAALTGMPALERELPEGVSVSRCPCAVLPALRTGAGEDVTDLLSQSGIPADVYSVAAGVKCADALRLNYTFETPDTAAWVSLALAEGSELTAVMDYASATDASGLAAVQTKFELGDGAVLRLVQIQRLGEGIAFINDVGGRCGKNARVEYIRLVLGGDATYDGFSAALEGDGSALTADIGYRVGGDGKLDMNFEAVHTGKATTSDISAAGVLSDRAFKLFRGTIDLRKGCSAAAGNEIEDVLLMDETVRNQTIPVILCGEEDVVGNHGATIGRLDEELIFYLESRGMERDEIYDMMARARVDAVIRKIPDEKTRRALLPALEEVDA